MLAQCSPPQLLGKYQLLEPFDVRKLWSTFAIAMRGQDQQKQHSQLLGSSFAFCASLPFSLQPFSTPRVAKSDVSHIPTLPSPCPQRCVSHSTSSRKQSWRGTRSARLSRVCCVLPVFPRPPCTPPARCPPHNPRGGNGSNIEPCKQLSCT